MTEKNIQNNAAPNNGMPNTNIPNTRIPAGSVQSGPMPGANGPAGPMQAGAVPNANAAAGAMPQNNIPLINRIEVYRYNRTFSKAMILALFSIILIYRNRASVCYPLFMLAMLGVLAWDCKDMGKSLIRNIEGKLDIKLFYCVSLILLAVSKAITASADLQWGSGIGILLITACLLLKLYCNVEAKDVTEQLVNIGRVLLTPLEHIDKIFSDFSITKKAEEGIESPTKKTMRSVILGLIIAVPLLMIILALLGSADLIFGDILTDILDSINFVDHMEDIFYVPIKFLITIIAFYAWLAMLPARTFTKMKEGKRFDAVVAITFNSLIALVYILFSGIQFVYLVGKMELPKGYTYAEYAHEGFYQLLAVTILNLILVSFCKKHFANNKVLRVILVIINMCTLVMIASSALRMFLYVQVYGLTHLRVYVLWLLVVLTVWTLLLTAGIFKEGIPFFKIITVFVTVWYLMFAYSLPDTWITAYDLTLEKLPSEFIISETYPDAAQVIRNDGRCWAEYCDYNKYDLQDYNRKNFVEKYREFNFMENRAMELMNSSK